MSLKIKGVASHTSFIEELRGHQNKDEYPNTSRAFSSPKYKLCTSLREPHTRISPSKKGVLGGNATQVFVFIYVYQV
jgi:hypothetical protein